jgi:hypothetical protein
MPWTITTIQLTKNLHVLFVKQGLFGADAKPVSDGGPRLSQPQQA